MSRKAAIEAKCKSWLSVHELGRDERIAACQRMAALIRGRSPAMVRRMEIGKFGRSFDTEIF